MKKIFLIIVVALCCSNIFAQQRHRLSNGEPYDIFLSVRPTAGMALGDFNKNYTYIYGADLAFEMQLEETKLPMLKLPENLNSNLTSRLYLIVKQFAKAAVAVN